MTASTRPTPPVTAVPPVAWARRNLFNSWYNSLLTMVLGVVAGYLAYRSIMFVAVNGRWSPVRVNLTLFMTGTFPRNEQWRLVAQIYLMAAAIGVAWGVNTASAADRAADTGIAVNRPSALDLLRRYWSLLLLLTVILGFTRTVWPIVFALTALVGSLGLRSAAQRLPRKLRRVGWYFAAASGIASIQVLTGTGGISWWWASALFSFAAFQFASERDFTKYMGSVMVLPIAGGKRLFTAKDLARFKRIAQILAVVAAVVSVRAIYWLVGGTASVGWDKWSGFHLTLVASFAAIILAFPIGMLLAMGRRSSLPAVRLVSVSYIEFFRGVPLITLLFTGDLFIGFFLDTDTPLSVITRAIIMLTIFTSAYVAEIVRGGLQAVPKGQIEAGQAIGLATPAIMRLIVLPQALRAVIPAMVGQFISLFKDSSLLSIISIVEFLKVRSLVHNQEAFRGFGIAETLAFVAFGYWAITYAMSKESERLERQLGVGER